MTGQTESVTILPGVVPRWEWRVFGEPFDVAEQVLGPMRPERTGTSEERYFLSAQTDASVKVRDGLMDVKVRLAMTVGDPRGIGPEIVAKTLADPRVDERCDIVVVGPEGFAIRESCQYPDGGRVLGHVIAEMRDGICRGLDLSADDRDEIRKRVFYESVCGRTGREFLAFLDSRLRMAPFDLLRIDPLLAYYGADPKDTKETADFLRVE